VIVCGMTCSNRSSEVFTLLVDVNGRLFTRNAEPRLDIGRGAVYSTLLVCVDCIEMKGITCTVHQTKRAG